MKVFITLVFLFFQTAFCMQTENSNVEIKQLPCSVLENQDALLDKLHQAAERTLSIIPDVQTIDSMLSIFVELNLLASDRHFDALDTIIKTNMKRRVQTLSNQLTIINEHLLEKYQIFNELCKLYQCTKYDWNILFSTFFEGYNDSTEQNELLQEFRESNKKLKENLLHSTVQQIALDKNLRIQMLMQLAQINLYSPEYDIINYDFKTASPDGQINVTFDGITGSSFNIIDRSFDSFDILTLDIDASKEDILKNIICIYNKFSCYPVSNIIVILEWFKQTIEDNTSTILANDSNYFWGAIWRQHIKQELSPNNYANLQERLDNAIMQQRYRRLQNTNMLQIIVRMIAMANMKNNISEQQSFIDQQFICKDVMKINELDSCVNVWGVLRKIIDISKFQNKPDENCTYNEGDFLVKTIVGLYNFEDIYKSNLLKIALLWGILRTHKNVYNYFISFRLNNGDYLTTTYCGMMNRELMPSNAGD